MAVQNWSGYIRRILEDEKTHIRNRFYYCVSCLQEENPHFLSEEPEDLQIPKYVSS
jgi:hypothetical protein